MAWHTLSLPGGSVVRNMPVKAGDAGSIPGLERSPGEENGNPLQYSHLEIAWTPQPDRGHKVKHD